MFLPPEQFPFTEILRAGWQDIRAEYEALDPDRFKPWVQREMYGHGWAIFGFHASGRPIAHNCARCPKTAALLAGVPGLTLAGFSRMSPHSHVATHVGWAKSVYRLHLGLVVPEGCTLRVADEVRAWREGEILIFDDTVPHEAFNRSDEIRTVLLLDFLRPGIACDTDPLPPEVASFEQYLRDA